MGNCVCMGLDPQIETLPFQEGSVQENLKQFFETLFEAMVKHSLFPSAFKPNIGYFSALDSPRRGDFSGSLALGDLLELLATYFPQTPLILDSKRGDIARSSTNYAIEAFEKWQCDAITLSPYMGTDSISPFLQNNKGAYILTRTSNPGAADFQQLLLENGEPLFMGVAKQVAQWGANSKGVGAVVGATNLKELSQVATFFAPSEVALLIPGVGSQGASAKESVNTLRESGYPLYLARINSSSGLTTPWKKESPPSNWLQMCINSIEMMIGECAL